MNKGIYKMDKMSHEGLSGVSVFQMDDTRAERGREQSVLVVCEPSAVIPLHTHEVDARMYVVSGQAAVLSDDDEINGKIVGPGDVVFFKKLIPHGFRATEVGFSFVSRNGGVCDSEDDWDMQFTA